MTDRATGRRDDAWRISHSLALMTSLRRRRSSLAVGVTSADATSATRTTNTDASPATATSSIRATSSARGTPVSTGDDR
jgi:hypothetical protein